MRFIGIFEKDIIVDQRVGETVFTQIYEAIIDVNSPKSMYEVYNTSSSPRAHMAYTTGYETYHQKTHFISADARKDIVFADTIFQTTEDGRKYVYTSIIAYLLRGQDALNCKMLNFKRKIYDMDLYMH